MTDEDIDVRWPPMGLGKAAELRPSAADEMQAVALRSLWAHAPLSLHNPARHDRRSQ
jgi:hypothetical protein